MLFNSYVFILAFLPITMLGFLFARRRAGREGAILWLVFVSFLYYGWWNPVYVPLLLLSITVNFIIGRTLCRMDEPRLGARRVLLAAGVGFNLALLGYFKYTNFFIEATAMFTDLDFTIAPIILPLGISFFTLQQIAYLADIHAGIRPESNYRHYALFVAFFPQLIAGPIVHHSEMMPQFTRDRILQLRARNVAVGATIFAIGLFKKVILADGVARFASPVFDAAADGAAPTLFDAWGGALAYTFQLYFDFSGYTDMAMGSALLFGIRLPLNFFSPYKATSIIGFWRRWHITLSRFLRDYLYIPLGGNRRGLARRYANLLVTMVLGGLWHGAGWNFVCWGALHGTYLAVNHGWRWWCGPNGLRAVTGTIAWRAGSWLVTFLAVVVGWVLFRAENLAAAGSVLRGMAGLNGAVLPNALVARLDPEVAAKLELLGIGTRLGSGETFVLTWLWLGALLLLVLAAPNVVQLTRAYRPTIGPFVDRVRFRAQGPRRRRRLAWQPSAAWAAAIAAIAAMGMLGLGGVSEFLYFKF